MINVKDLLKRFTTEELNQKAEEYFAKIDDRTYLLAKPFANVEECSKILFSFAALLPGLRLAKGMDVMEFGAGPAWCSHLLTQMGCKTYAVDVSQTALDIAKERHALHPPFGDQPPPEFLAYEGHRLPFPDASLDRILCFDAFHHVPNPEPLLVEMARVLRKDGVAGFAEPGPEHSHGLDAQAEMETHGVLENDIVMEDIKAWADRAGFQRLELVALGAEPVRLGLHDYERFVIGPSALDAPVLDAVRHQARAARIFFLGKEAEATLDSRSGRNLVAELEVVLKGGPTYAASGSIDLSAQVKNTSPAVWLPRSAKVGGVGLGVQILSARGVPTDYFRLSLTPGEGVPLRPGDAVSFDARIPCPPPGEYDLEFDLVSEHVVWFKLNGSKTCRFRVQVE
jgi:ubiquinone/menaquinone biosynthesis C-methylase UbiE